MRMNRFAPLRRLVTRLGHDRRGTALTEFAFAAPILVSLGVLGLETAQFAIANLRITQMAAIVADSASRVRERMDEGDVIDILTGAKMTGTGLKFADNGRIVLSSLEQNAAKNGQWIRWQRCDGKKNVQSSYGLEDKGKTDASLQSMGPPGRQIAAQGDATVMFVEIFYDYQPIISTKAIGPYTITTTLAFNVRQRSDQSLSNTNSVTAKSCTVYNA